MFIIFFQLILEQFIYRKYYILIIIIIICVLLLIFCYNYYDHYRSRDSDIDIISTSVDKFTKDHKPPAIRKKPSKGDIIFDQDIADRVLCPPLDALDAMAKPSIYGACSSNPLATSKGCYALGFQIPDFLDLSGGDVSMYELQV